MPIRIQRRRVKGWRMTDGAIYVGRPTKWGNPFPWSGDWIVWAAVAAGFRADKPGRVAAAVAYYREWLTGTKAAGPLAHSKEGDVIEYESGLALDSADAARGMARGFALLCGGSIRVPRPPSIEEIRADLRGHDLACFCPIIQDGEYRPCHADVLLSLANDIPMEDVIRENNRRAEG